VRNRGITGAPRQTHPAGTGDAEPATTISGWLTPVVENLRLRRDQARAELVALIELRRVEHLDYWSVLFPAYEDVRFANYNLYLFTASHRRDRAGASAALFMDYARDNWRQPALMFAVKSFVQPSSS
jgi:hypothetical protein